ncbi:MAG: ribosome silencing factor [Bacteroidales bacterium]|nr:ribosome silencing factor [Bacteroidales bacterium]
MKKRSDGTEVLLKGVIKGIFEKKGLDVLKLDLRKLENRITDYFVICHGTSVTQVDSICFSVEEIVRKIAGEKPVHVEGLDNCFWVLLDYGDVVVHIFLKEYRDFYSLESLWADAGIEEMEDKKMKVKTYDRK